MRKLLTILLGGLILGSLTAQEADFRWALVNFLKGGVEMVSQEGIERAVGNGTLRICFSPLKQLYLYIFILGADYEYHELFSGVVSPNRKGGENLHLFPSDWEGLLVENRPYTLYFLVSRHPRQELEEQFSQYRTKSRIKDSYSELGNIKKRMESHLGKIRRDSCLDLSEPPLQEAAMGTILNTQNTEEISLQWMMYESPEELLKDIWLEESYIEEYEFIYKSNK